MCVGLCGRPQSESVKNEILMFMFDPVRKRVNGGCRRLYFEELPLLLPFHKYLYH